MSKFSCPVVRVAAVEEHPNADRLSLVRLEGLGYLCIANKLEDGSPRYKPGDWVVYIPSASVLPEWLLKDMGFWNEDAGKGVLAGSDGNRVKPLKLRGIFSEGVLYGLIAYGDDDCLSADFGSATDVHVVGKDSLEYPVKLGEDAAAILGITRWEPPIPAAMSGEVASVAEAALTYDFQRWESVPDIFEPGEVVVAQEKIHGSCTIIQYFPGMDHPEMFPDHAGYRSITVSSKGLGGQGLVFKNNEANANNLYVRALGTLLADHDLAGLLHRMSKVDGGAHPVAILGEVFGKGVQDLDYGTTKPTFRVFDMRIGREWLSPDAVAYWAKDLPCVPTLYTGPFDQTAIEAVRDGVTTVGGTNVREGVVVRSMISNEHPLHGRKICKFISPAYLLRRVKNGEATEFN
jgi:RNA ligase (TIGR02306 family)